MKKKMQNDVYVLEGVESTAQMSDFYKEVVEKNIEKYFGITAQGRRFKFDAVTNKAVLLNVNEEYAVNPNYRKIEVADVKLDPVEVKEPVTKKADERDVLISQLKESLANCEKEKALAIERATVAENDWKVIGEKNKQLREEVAQKDVEVTKLTDELTVLRKDAETESKLAELVDEIEKLGFEVLLKRCK